MRPCSCKALTEQNAIGNLLFNEKHKGNDSIVIDSDLIASPSFGTGPLFQLIAYDYCCYL